jgi:hypothetical protein
MKDESNQNTSNQNRDMFLGELRAFREQTVKELEYIKHQIVALNNFRLKMLGASGLMAFLATILIEYFKRS